MYPSTGVVSIIASEFAVTAAALAKIAVSQFAITASATPAMPPSFHA